MSREQFAAFIRLGRFKFLLESLLTVTLGITIAVYQGHSLSVGSWLMVQLFVSATHLMTHYCNEYFDLEADSAHTAPTAWTGGSQVLAQGLLRPVVSLSAAFVLLFLLVLLIAAMPNLITRILAAAILALAWFYTAPPIRLNHRRLGEITTAGVLTLLCPALSCYAQVQALPPLLFAVCIPLFLFMTARMMVMNLCDRDSDLAVGKRTLPTTLGARRATFVIIGLDSGAYAMVLVMTVAGPLPALAGVGVLLTAPLAVILIRQLLSGPPTADDPVRANTIAGRATRHAASTGYLATLGLIVSAAGWRPPAGVQDRSAMLCAVVFLLYNVLFAVQTRIGRQRDRSGSRLVAS